MQLSDYTFKPFYTSYENDVVNEFYIPALSRAKYYNRVSAYFDANILAYYARGLISIYNNNGKIRFVFSHQIEERDFLLIKEGYEINNDLVEKLKINISTSDLSEEKLANFSNIAYLIQIGMVDIKIAFTKSGIFHDKFGLIYDENDNYLYFRGSNNETVAAILNNYERFEVSVSWHQDIFENNKITSAVSSFEKLWHNEVDNIIVVDMPTVIKNEIIKYSQGKVIDYFELQYNDSFVLDFENGKLIGINFLKNNVIDERDLILKLYLKRFIKLFTSKKIIFNSGLDYGQIKIIIDHFTKYSKKMNFRLIISQELSNFLDNMDLHIESRRKLGILIKNQSTEIISEFYKFEHIVNSELHRKLRPQQMWDAFHMTSMVRSANFSVPGAGKTSIVYGSFAYLSSKSVNEVDKIIMIGPINSFTSWLDEFIANFGSKRKLKSFNTRDSRFKNKEELIYNLRFESGSANLILVNYERVDSIKEVLIEIINEKTMLVFDEIHRVKAIDGERAKASLKVSNGAKYRSALTGTPIPNSYLDIYNILRILYKEEYDMFFKFSQGMLKNPSKDDIQNINEKIYPFYCRTTKKQLNVPQPDDDIIIECHMTSKEEELFQMIYERYHNHVFSLYIRLIQASTNPELLLKSISDEDIRGLVYNEDDEEKENIKKVDSFYTKDIYLSKSDISLIKEVPETGKFKKGINLVIQLASEGKQVIVWAIFVDTIKKINKYLLKNNISSKYIVGDVLPEERENTLSGFKNKGFQVLIANPHTIAESVSLHHTCHDAVYFEYSFNLTHMLQSRDRIHRLGLPEGQYTRFYYLMLKSSDFYYKSIDEKIYKRLSEKRDIMYNAIESTHLEFVYFDELDDIKSILK